MVLLKETDPKDFAWSSTSRALQFSHALADVMIGNANGIGLDKSGSVDVFNERIGAVLQVLKDFAPVKLTTVWKLKARAKHGSLIAATKEYEEYLNPSDQDERRELVCGFHESHLKIILELYRKKMLEVSAQYRRGIVYIPDITLLRPRDGFVPKEQLRDYGLKELLAVPFWRERTSPRDGSMFPNFFINLYLSEHEHRTKDLKSSKEFIPQEFIDAIESKLISGIRAVNDHRLVAITKDMSDVSAADIGADSDLAMDNALIRVLPKYIMCERMIKIFTSEDGAIKSVSNFLINEKNMAVRHERLARKTEELLVELAQDIMGDAAKGNIIEKRFSGIQIASSDNIEFYLKDTELAGVKSLLIGAIHNRTFPDQPRGYLILANRLSDLSTRRRPHSRVQDFFDWDDEKYLNHICSILDFIAELFTGEVARMQRAHILSHEMHAPTEAIYSTTERIRDSISGKKVLPDTMMLRELQDILDVNDLQTALIDSLMFGLRTGKQPPAKVYQPQKTDLNKVAEAVERMVKYLCRRHKVSYSSIKMGNFPTLNVDKRAATQLFLNVLTNAIKYQDHDIEFMFHGFAENVSASELISTEIPRGFLEKLKALEVQRGYLFYFQDHGIGVPLGLENRIFRPGIRGNVERVLEVQGAGLGLAVARTIANDHFGEIWLEKHKGPTTFCLFLPDLVESNFYHDMTAWRGEGTR